MANENGWNKHDAWAVGLSVGGFLVSTVCTLLSIGQSNKASNQRAAELNARLDPSLRQPNPPQV